MCVPLDEAGRLLTRALPVYERAYSAGSAFTQRIVRDLVRLAEARGGGAAAARYRARLAT